MKPLGISLFVIVLLLSLFAIQHSVMARPEFKRWWTQIVPWSVERSLLEAMKAKAASGRVAWDVVVRADAEPQGESLVVWDDLGAGIGETVCFSEGGEAVQPFKPDVKPVAPACVSLPAQRRTGGGQG